MLIGWWRRRHGVQGPAVRAAKAILCGRFSKSPKTNSTYAEFSKLGHQHEFCRKTAEVEGQLFSPVTRSAVALASSPVGLQAIGRPIAICSSRHEKLVPITIEVFHDNRVGTRRFRIGAFCLLAELLTQGRKRLTNVLRLGLVQQVSVPKRLPAARLPSVILSAIWRTQRTPLRTDAPR